MNLVVRKNSTRKSIVGKAFAAVVIALNFTGLSFAAEALGAAKIASPVTASPIAAAATSAPATSLITIDAGLNEKVVMIPEGKGEQAAELETTVFKPPGDGPFPVLIMNHGKALGNPHSQSRDRFVVLSKEFVKRGYAVVVPMRKGFSKSTGQYADYGCDMTNNGLGQAEDLQGTMEYLRTQPWADIERVVVAGQSYGGLTAMAFGMRNYHGVRGLINFAGGLKMHGGDCAWQSSLVKAFATYGEKTTLKSLWFYGENDQHFSPELATRMYNAYVQAGGDARLVAYGPFKKDAHGMVGSRDGVHIWWPETEKFLKEIGMPTEQVFALADDIKLPGTNYAALDDANAIPYLRDRGREQYRVFLGKSTPRAFAISSSGAWSWAEDGDDPVSQALTSCQKNSSTPCKLYAVDNTVVWSNDSAPAPLSTPAAPVTASATPSDAPRAANAATGP